MSPALLLSRADVERLLAPGVCIAALEDAFSQLAQGRLPPPGILGMHAGEGSFHVKAGFLDSFFAAKINANFPENGSRRGLPTIQGAVLLFDAANGAPLAAMDSIAITAIRTAAASAVAAKHLARERSESLLICGCGGQARAQLQALLEVRRPGQVLAYDQDLRKAEAFASQAGATPVTEFSRAARESDLIVTCTTARRYFLTRDMVRPGTFIAAVGADHEDKQEIEPELLASSKVVTDLTAQAAKIGDLHHAIEAGAMRAGDVHAELAEVVAGTKPGRERDDEIIVFDSTGTGLQDVAAAIAVYRRAVQSKEGREFSFASSR